jgi:antitoxin component of RelBE/YafQ-DinJ toxin-antitoxin module
MSNDTVLNVKIDKTLKDQARAAAKALDLPLSTVVAAGLRDFVRTRSITISDTPRLKPGIEAELLEMSKQYKAGTLDVSPAFDNLEESFAWLDAELEKERSNT